MMKFCECCDSKPATHEADWISDGHIVGKVLVCGKCLAVGSVSGNYYEEIRKLKFIFKNPSRKQTPIGMFTTYLVNADKQGSMLIGEGHTVEESIANARQEIENAGIEVEPDSTLETEEMNHA